MGGGNNYTNGNQPALGGWNPAGGGGAPGQHQSGPLTSLNAGQRNYVVNQGKLPPLLGGGNLSAGQQNYVNNNWAPKSNPQLGAPDVSGPNANQPAWFTGGTPLLNGQPNNSLMQAFQQMFGGGGGYGNNYLY